MRRKIPSSKHLFSKSKNFLIKLKEGLFRLRVFYLFLLYKLHIKIRYLHDATYLKVPVYKKYTDKGYSNTIHKTVLVAFISSFATFMFLQYGWPLLFNPAAPGTAYAGTNTKVWTTQADFQGATTNSNIDFTSTADSVQLASNNLDFGTGADGDVSLNRFNVNINIKDIYELDSVTGVTSPRGVDKGLNKGVGSYNPATGAVPNFNNLTITNTTGITNPGPGSSTPGVLIKFKVKNRLTIDATSRIKADFIGYGGGTGWVTGPGAGTCNGTPICGGSSYGGVGGYGYGGGKCARLYLHICH